VLAIAAFGAVGLFLADLGWYGGVAVLVLGAPLFAGLCACARPVWRRNRERAGAASTRGAVAAVALSIAYAVWNGANASEHVQINRDGGLYLNTGKWIATHGSLIVHPLVGPFASSAGLTNASNGVAVNGRELEFSLSHMLPALLAEAHSLGGDRMMFLAVPIMSGLALLAFYLLASRVLRSSAGALAAAACLALVMPQVSFSRDTTSEIPMQVLVFAAVWLLCVSETWDFPRVALCAGLLLGLVQPLHIDGLAYLLGLPLVGAAVWLDRRHRKRRVRRAAFVWMGIGALAGLSLGILDVTLRGHGYLSSVRGQVVALAVAGALVLAAGVGVLLAHRADLRIDIARVREPLARAAGVGVLVVGFAAWFLRPLVQVSRGKDNGTVIYVQNLGSLPVDAARRYAERSVQWIAWYLGPLSLTLAIFAAAVVVYLLVRGSLRLPPKIVLFMLAPPALLYLWRPSITPDHIWAMRRFLPAVFPGVILLVFGAIVAIARAPRPFSPRLRTGVAVILAIGAIGYPAWATSHVFDMTEQRGEYATVRAACRLLGPRSAAVVLQESSFVHQNDPQTLRSFCNVPVSVMTTKADPAVLRDLARRWRVDGRQLFVVAEFPATVRQALPGVAVRTTPVATNRHFLNYTLLWRPSHYQSESLSFATAPVPTR